MATKNKNIKMPLVAIKNLVIFPNMSIHFDIGREKSILALQEAMDTDQKVFVVLQKNEDENIDLDNIELIGTVCTVKQIVKLPNNIVRVLLEGVSRGIMSFFYDVEPYLECEIDYVVDPQEATHKQIAYMRSISEMFESYVSGVGKFSTDILDQLKKISSPGEFCDTIASFLMLTYSQKLELFKEVSVTKRLELLYDMMVEETKIFKIEQKINQKMRREMNKNEKIHYLKQRLQAINTELGEYGDGDLSLVKKYKEQLKKIKVNEDIKEKIEKEISKLERSGRSGMDSEVSRNYIEMFFSLPWNESTEEKIDLKKAQEILDEEHFGMEKVKERIIEYLAVRKLSNNLKSPIICFVGPPGVGKTSIAKSIAKSVNRKFARISLGGVRDEAEIRGHRRTYVGAIPGRIINSLIQVKSNNPVILFDEIDKMSKDFRGSVESAMLEVLDPEQNKTFTDHYLEYEFDLSKILFITTANSLDTIPMPLRDRMEIIQLSGYTQGEKMQIARKYLLPKQLKEHHFSDDFIQISDEIMDKIITNFTRESGVRNLEQKLAKICRKAAKKKVLSPRTKKVVVKSNELEDYLGKQVFTFEKKNDAPQVGIVRGLAWTQVGGDTLSIELNVMNGSGKIELTGKLGDVMKESAKTALSYVRSISDEYDIEPEFYKTKDIHIHIPEGATPKDGPSAGITMATAILSALSNIRVREDIAMTGEITLRGRVLPVGGIKEKLLAAHRAGIKNIILPKENEKDLKDLPDEVRDDMSFTLASNMKEVLDVALLKQDIKKTKKREKK